MSPTSCTFCGIFLILVLSAGVARATDRIVVGPWSAVDGSPQVTWMNAGIQQTLVADLSRPGQTDAVLLKPGNGDPLIIAAGQDGRWLVTGKYQVIDAQVRLTGQVIDLSTGQAIGGLKTTGTERDIFSLQDELSRQTQNIIRKAIGPSTTHPPTTAPAVSELVPTGPIRIVVEQQPNTNSVPFDGSSLQRAVDAGQIDPRRTDRVRNEAIYEYGYTGYFRSPVLIGGYSPPWYSNCFSGYPGHYWTGYRHVDIHIRSGRRH